MSATATARDRCLAPARSSAPIHGGRYGRLFPELPALDVDEQALRALGRAEGPCDVGAAFVDDETGAVAAIWPFFGQFIAHDLTADRSPLRASADQDQLRNFRTPRANLESLYGAGPVGAPYLYDREDPAKLLLAPGGADVARGPQGIALLGDPRNDVHLFVNQLQVAFARLHNRLVDRLRADGVEEHLLLEEARRATSWHYQEIIVGEYLPGLIGGELLHDLLTHRLARLYDPGAAPSMPLEFAHAAFRYGHAQTRQRYQVNAGFGPCSLFPDLMGFGPVDERHAIDWALHVDLPGRPPAQRAKRIDARLPRALIDLPVAVAGERPGSDYASLANRDLQRGQAVGLPSGEAVADALGVRRLSADELALADHGWHGETPLWLYVLKEAEVLHGGDQLGPVGGRIVGETLIGLLEADPESTLAVDPHWLPTLPGQDGAFGLADVVCPEDDQRTNP